VDKNVEIMVSVLVVYVSRFPDLKLPFFHLFISFAKTAEKKIKKRESGPPQ
jgi:hypothetical protein